MYSRIKRKLKVEGNARTMRKLKVEGNAHTMRSHFSNGTDVSPRRRMVLVYCRRFLDRSLRCIRVNIMEFTRNEFAYYCHSAVFDGFTREMEIPEACVEYSSVFWTDSSYDWDVGLPMCRDWDGFQRDVCFVLVQGDLVPSKYSVVTERRNSTLLFSQRHLDGNITCHKVDTDPVKTYGEFVNLARASIDHCVREFKLGERIHNLSIVLHCWKISGSFLVRLPDEEAWKSVSRNALYYFARSAEDSQKVQILFRQHIRDDKELHCIYFDIRSCPTPEKLVEKVRSLVFQGYEGPLDGLDVDLKWVSRDDSNLYRLPIVQEQWQGQWHRFFESVAYIFGMPAWVKPPLGGKRKR